MNVDSRSSRWPPLKGIELEDKSLIGGYEWTPLMVAAGEGHPVVVDLLVDSGADVNATNFLGQTSLHFAVASFPYARQAENLDIVRSLVTRGANVTCKDQEGRQPLHTALSKGYETAQLLSRIAAGENVF